MRSIIRFTSRAFTVMVISTMFSFFSLYAGNTRAAPQTYMPVHCKSSVCLVLKVPGVDSDHDGISDDDEIAAGTNPNDAASHPPILKLFESAAYGKLRSFNKGHSEILILPTKDPEGNAIGNKSFIPQRDSIFKSFGLGKDLLSKAGLNPENGLRMKINSESARMRGEKSNGSGHPPIKIGGLDVGLISGGYNGNTTLFAVGPNSGKNAAGEAKTTFKDGEFITLLKYKDGASDKQVLDTATGEVKQTSKDANGNVIGVAAAVVTDKEVGSTTESYTVTTSTGTTNGTSTTTTGTSGVQLTLPTVNSTTPNPKLPPPPPKKDDPKPAEPKKDDPKPAEPKKDETKKYTDPEADSIGVIFISEADMNRVKNKINSNKKTGPVIVGPTIDPDIIVDNFGADPMVALFDEAQNIDKRFAPFLSMVLVPNHNKASPEVAPRLRSRLDGVRPGRCGSCNSR
jgi:Bacterial TSP3 repeat